MPAASVIVENVVAFEVAAALVDKFGGDSLAGDAGPLEAVSGNGAQAVSRAREQDLRPTDGPWEHGCSRCTKHTKIRLCRIAFVATCLVPTCAVAAWGCVVRLPELHPTSRTRQSPSSLGLHARLTKASSPRPGLMLFESLELSDPDTRIRWPGSRLSKCKPSGDTVM